MSDGYYGTIVVHFKNNTLVNCRGIEKLNCDAVKLTMHNGDAVSYDMYSIRAISLGAVSGPYFALI